MFHADLSKAPSDRRTAGDKPCRASYEPALGSMRRFPMSAAPNDGSVIVGCTRVEGVEHDVSWTSLAGGGWIEEATGIQFPANLFVEWRHRNDDA